jgi:hypothetical protein
MAWLLRFMQRAVAAGEQEQALAVARRQNSGQSAAQDSHHIFANME